MSSDPGVEKPPIAGDVVAHTANKDIVNLSDEAIEEPKESEKAEPITKDDKDAEEAEKEYPHWTKTIMIILALYLSLFLISLVRHFP